VAVSPTDRDGAAVARVLSFPGLAAPARAQPALLAPLREDVKLLPGPTAYDGAPTWTLYDPATHRFFRIGWAEFEILSRWNLGSIDRVATAVAGETTIRATPADVLDVVRFVEAAGLVMPLGDAGVARLVAAGTGRRDSAAGWLLKNYLFLRIPLINPDRLLGHLLGLVRWMMTPGFAAVLSVLALTGFYLIARQWEAFSHSFLHVFSLQGALIVGLALSLSKIVHEIGHGLMTKRFGCRVPAMGVALLVLWPVLWTDTTDAWRLTSRRQRVAIDAAGMLAEITLAIFASLAWSMLPDGATRTAMFMLASSTWILTLAVNLNPMMRFDGYFLLSDLLDMPNLQERAFALARWWMREWLFGLGDPPPERFAPARQQILLCYAYCTWVYRFTLFAGIAFLVYHFTFKALGLLLMAVEIGWFIVRPIASEIWLWRRRLSARRITLNSVATFSILLASLAALLVPWPANVEAPALLRAERQTALYTGVAGQLTEFAVSGVRVEAGQPIAKLQSPDIDYRRAKTLATIEGLRAQLAGQAFDRDARNSLEFGWNKLEHAIADLSAVEAEATALVVRAGYDGVVMDVPPHLRPGLWMPRREVIAYLIDPSTQVVEAFVEEADLSRVYPGAEATFFPENNEDTVALTVATVSLASVTELDTPEIASINGGGVAVRKSPAGKLVPDAAVYKVRLVPRQMMPTIARKQRGAVEIKGDEVALLSRLYQRVAAIVIREAGL
jgi:putative peptide zinc metalloprotease protein